MRRPHAPILVPFVAVLLTMSTSAAGQESLATARQLYASAEYQDALTILNHLLAGSPSQQERQSIELYRTFCLVAIGSADEATSAIEAMVAHDPLYRPDMDDLPPRLRTAFTDTRRRLLPAIIQQKYVSAKSAFDRHEFKVASDGFTQVLVALSDPDLAQIVNEPPLADLRLLAASFNELTVRSLTPPPPLPSATLAVGVPPSGSTADAESASGAPPASASSSATTAPTPASRVVPARPPVIPRPLTIYSIEDRGVERPVIIKQDVPRFQGRVTARKVGIIDIVINTTGAVESVTIVEPTNPSYDRTVIAASKNWAYRPARIDGTPVKFRKRIQITLSPEG